MAKKKHPKQATKIPALPPREPVLSGDVLMHVFRDLGAAMRELDARRRYDADVTEYLKTTGNSENFEMWRLERNKADGTSV